MSIKELRERACLEQGPTFGDPNVERGRASRLLNLVLAAERLNLRRYSRHASIAARSERQDLAAAFLEHAAQKQRLAERLVEHIVELDGEPGCEWLASDPVRAETTLSQHEVPELIREGIVAECLAMDLYSGMIPCLRNSHPTLRDLLEELLALGEALGIRLITILRTRNPLRVR